MAKEIGQLYMPAFKRSYGKESVRQVTNALPAIKNAGFSGIYLIALWNSDCDNGFGIVDYTVNPDFGTMDEYKSLIEAAHDLGLEVGVDVVPNHVSRNNFLARNCLTGVPEFKDALYVVSKEEAERLTKAGVPSFFGKLAYSDFGDKYVRSTFVDHGQLNVNWESEVVRMYFKQVFEMLRGDGIDFVRVDCGPLLLEDVTKADPNNPFACMRPKESLEAIRKVSGNMPLFVEWFDPKSADLFNDMENCWALDCEHVITGKPNTQWNHEKLVAVFGGHDQMTFYDRGFENPEEILERAKKQKCVFSDMQTKLKWRTDASILPGDEEYDASLENPNQRYRGRRAIHPVLDAFIKEFG